MANIATLRLGIDATGARQGAREFEQSAHRVNQSASGISRVLGGLFAGAALASAATKAARTIAGFEQTMATLRAVAIDTTRSLEAQEAQFSALSAAAREMGATTKFSAQEAAEGLLFLARAGYDAQAQLDSLPHTLNLAAAGGLELGQAADFASNIVAQFGLQAAETERVVDTLITTSNAANTNVMQLAEAMKYAGPVAGSLGISLEETAAAVGVLGDRGIQGTMAGRGLRGVLASLLGPTAEAKQALDDLGLSFDRVNPEEVGLIDALYALNEAHLDATSALQIFGRENVSAALTMVESAERLDELRIKSEENTHAGQQMADAMNNTILGSFRSLKSAVEELYLQMGDRGLSGAMRAVIDTATDTVRILAGMEDKVDQNDIAAKALAHSIESMTYGLAGLVAVKLAGWLTAAISGVTNLGAAMSAVGAAARAHPAIALFSAFSAAAAGLIPLIENLNKVRSETVDLRESMASLESSVGSVERAYARFTRAIERSDEASAAAAIRAQIEAIDSSIFEMQAKINKLGEEAATASVDQVTELFGGLGNVSASTDELVDRYVKTLADSLMRAQQDPSFGYFDLADSPIGRMLGDPSKVAQQWQYAFTRKLEELVRVPGQFGDVLFFDESKAMDAAKGLVDSFGLQRVAATDVIEVLERLRGEEVALQKSYSENASASGERASGYEREAQGVDLLGRGIQALGGAFRDAVDMGMNFLEGTDRLDEYLRRLQDETTLVAANAEDREALAAVMRAEQVARQYGIELTDDYIAKIQEEIRTQQMLRDEREKAIEQANRFKDFQFIPEGDIQGPTAPRLGSVTDLADMVDGLRQERELLGLVNDERERRILLLEFDQRAVGIDAKMAADLRDQLLSEYDALRAHMVENDLANAIKQGFERGIEDALMNLDNLKDAAMSILQEIQRAFIRAFIAQTGVQTFLSGLAGGIAGGGGGTTGALHGAVVGSGGAFDFMARGGFVGLAGGGFTDRPTAVGMVGDRIAVSSEFGQREAVMPVKRVSGGDLGVKVELPDQGPRRVVNITNTFPNVTNRDEFESAQRHSAADARRKLGSF